MDKRKSVEAIMQRRNEINKVESDIPMVEQPKEEIETIAEQIIAEMPKEEPETTSEEEKPNRKYKKSYSSLKENETKDQ